MTAGTVVAEVKVSLDDAARTIWTFKDAIVTPDSLGGVLVITLDDGQRQVFPMHHVLWWSEKGKKPL